MGIRPVAAVAAIIALAFTLTPASSETVISSKGEQQFSAYITGYSYWDNTPPGSAAIARPVLHREAGGSGTYRDPITIAVGHVIADGRHTFDFAAGTLFYIESLRKYAIVEDACGDGAQPQNGPCHSGWKGHPWLDLYIGGAAVSPRQATACAERITRVQTIVLNPGPDYPVHRGEVMASGCRTF